MIFATSAQANETYYGFNIESLTFSPSGIKDHTALAGSVAAGLKFNPNFALEARLGLGLTEGKQTENYDWFGDEYKLETTLKLNNYFAVYAVGLIPVNEKFSGHVKAGFSSISVKGSYTDTGVTVNYSDSGSATTSENGFSYRFGGTYKLDNKMSVIAEYGNLPAGSDLEITLLTVGLNVNF